MSTPAYGIIYSAQLSGSAVAGLAGDVLIPDATTGLYTNATTANRGTRRSTGVALTAYAAGGTVSIQQFGQLDATTARLSSGAASWVRVSSTGSLERVTPSGSDDVVGWCETDGTLHCLFGVLTAAITTGGGTVPSGTGYPHVTGGVYDAAAVALTWTGDATGTGTGASFALTVVKVNGASIPASGALTTGNAAYVSGANALTYGALNLAGGAGWVTGALPLGNQAAPTGTGLVKVSGGWVAAGATLVNADVNAAAAIAVSKLAASGTNGWVLTTTAGVPVWQAPSGGGASAGGAGQVQTSDGLGGFTAPTDVLAGADFLSIGATPAATGALRLANASGILAQNVGATADISICFVNSANELYFGSDGSFTTTATHTRLWADTDIWIGIGTGGGAVNQLHINASNIASAVPNVGDGVGSPWGAVDGEVLVDMNNLPYTLAASEYCFQVIKVKSTANFTLARVLTFPAPATDAQAYKKFVRNTQAGAFAVTCSTGFGVNISIAQGKGAWILFDATNGCQRMTADTVSSP